MAWATASRTRPSAVGQPPTAAAPWRRSASPIRPETGPIDEHRQRARQHQQPGAGRAEAEAVAGGLRRLGELGIRMNEPNMPKPTSTVARLVISTGGRASVRMSASGCAVRRSRPTQTARTTRPTAIRPIVRAAAPAPRRGRGRSPSSGSDEADGEQPAPRSRRARARGRRLGHADLDRDRGGDRHDGADPEDPVVGGLVDEHAADHEARCRRRCRRSPRSSRCRRRPVARELVADDAEAEREDAAAEALEHAAGDDQPSVADTRRRRPSPRRSSRARSRASGACRTCRPGARTSGVATAAASR